MQTVEQTRSRVMLCGPFNNVAISRLLADWHRLPRAGWCGKYPGIVAQMGRDFTAEDLLAYLAHRAAMEE